MNVDRHVLSTSIIPKLPQPGNVYHVMLIVLDALVQLQF